MVAASEEGNGVAINRQTELRPLRNREPLGEVAQYAREFARLIALEQQVPTPSVLDTLDRARRWPDDHDRGSDFRDESVQPGGAARREARRGVLCRPAEHDVRDPDVGGVRRLDAAG